MDDTPPINRRIRWLTLVALILLAAHAVEEWFTGMVRVDPVFRAAAQLPGGAPEAAFVAFQVTWLLCLAVLLIAMTSERARLWILLAFGGLCFAELQHVVLAIVRHAYYPGSVTSTIIFLFSLLYLRELRLAHRRLTHH